MFLLKQSRLFPSMQKLIPLHRRKGSRKLPEPWDLMTGLERWQALQYAKGNWDPFLRFPVKGGGTKDCPTIVRSPYDKRVVGCVCGEDATTVVWWWLHEGFPRRCDCNHWFVLERFEMPKIYEDVCP